jgi:hypothetical protein
MMTDGSRCGVTRRWTPPSSECRFHGRAGPPPHRTPTASMFRITRGIHLGHTPVFAPRLLRLPDGTPVPLHEYDERLAEYEAAHRPDADPAEHDPAERPGNDQARLSS